MRLYRIQFSFLSRASLIRKYAYSSFLLYLACTPKENISDIIISVPNHWIITVIYFIFFTNFSAIKICRFKVNITLRKIYRMRLSTRYVFFPLCASIANNFDYKGKKYLKIFDKTIESEWYFFYYLRIKIIICTLC